MLQYIVALGRHIRLCFALLGAWQYFAVPTAAQTGITSGLYEIVSGTYQDCCGIAGGNRFSLPNDRQSYVSLTVDSQQNLASMTFLGKDRRSVFSITPCPGTGPPIYFSLNYGFILSNSIFFHVDPGPLPYATYWNYSVSNNSPNTLLINGVLGTAHQGCIDAPTQFSHTNVVATLIPPPQITLSEFSPANGALLFVEGQAGWTNVIEASADLVSWTPITTNVMPPTMCPICPFITYRDAASTNSARRFYRSYEFR